MVSGAPYWVYQDEATYRLEQKMIFEGPVWNYLCLEADVTKPGDYRTTFVGEMPVIVVRGEDGEIYAFENRCAHRGALIALDDGGRNAKDFQCVYHAWTYDLKGNLKGVAFEEGSNGQGGMPRDFRKEQHGPGKLYTATLCGLVFASLSDNVPPIEDYLGEAILARIERVLCKPIRVIGRYTQALPNNWKLYEENVKDTYHASLLHLFFGTFRLPPLTQGGGGGQLGGVGCGPAAAAKGRSAAEARRASCRPGSPARWPFARGGTGRPYWAGTGGSAGAAGCAGAAGRR